MKEGPSSFSLLGFLRRSWVRSSNRRRPPYMVAENRKGCKWSGGTMAVGAGGVGGRLAKASGPRGGG
ncbi:hypothetical protein V6Z11_A11G364600 [Gossypium hirsutum]